ncbi:MAG: ABC transporter substrate-binding protein [Clostridiales bacterium]|nr:ABC transporter substrate-binding protein [Clostridiales bacterium]
MKQMRALSLAATAALTVSLLAGCGGSGTANTSAPGGPDAPSGSSSAATIKIGGIGPLTGSAAVYGVATQQGAQLAVDEINAKGGLQFELNFQDDENDAEKATNAYNVLQDWGMQVLYGCTTTNPCVAVASSTYADRYFQLTPSASSTDVTSGKDNAFQICFTDPNQGSTAADYIAAHPELGSKIAVIYNNGDAYSTGIATAFRAEAEAKGLEVVSETTFPSDDNTDFSVQLGDAQSNGADLVFMPIYYTPASLILNQAKNMGYAPTFFGCDGMDGILAVDGFDTTLADGLVLMTAFNPWGTDELSANFTKSYEEKYGSTPNQFAADGYDCIYAIAAACEKAGITADMGHEDVCEKLIETFTSSDFRVDGLTGTGMTWGANGEVSKAPVVVKVEDAKYITIE